MCLELREEVELELARLNALVKSFRPLLTKTKEAVPDTIETVALAGFLHSLYTGIENIFKRIALHAEKKLPEGPAWHSRLLEEMAEANTNRPPVISHELRDTLSDYLSFRHVFRHAYSFELKWKKMAPLVSQCENTCEQLQVELNRFFERLGMDDYEEPDS